MAWHKIFESEEVAASGNVTSSSVVLMDKYDVHAFQYTVTGSGTVDISVYTSIDGADFISNGVKASEITVSSGPEEDGKGIVPLALLPGDQIRFKLEEVGGASSVTVSMWFVQK